MDMVKTGERRSRRPTDSRTGSVPNRPSPPPSTADVPERGVGTDRDDELAALIDHCTAAQVIAEDQDEKFLSYMLAMTLQAARGIKRARERT